MLEVFGIFHYLKSISCDALELPILVQISLKMNVPLCRQNSSLLRLNAPEDVVNLSWWSLREEWKARAPVFYSFLVTACTSNSNTDGFPGLVVAGSVLLKQRNTLMNAIAAQLGLAIKSGTIEVNSV